MGTGRLEAFSDGVLAIIITIMVLELRVPASEVTGVATFGELRAAHLLPVFLSYVLSFVYIAIYWNNHHHLMYATSNVTGGVLWANMHLLFWLSLIPFVTNWMGENPFDAAPAALYGVVLLCAGTAYYILSRTIIRSQGSGSLLAAAVGRDKKGIISMVVYALALPAAYLQAGLAYLLYVLVAAMWIVPDRRIERAVAGSLDSGAA
jgi:uncharacterized membrane protein